MPSIVLNVEVGHPDPKMLPAHSSTHKTWQDPGSSHCENRSSSSYRQGRLRKDWGKCAKQNPKHQTWGKEVWTHILSPSCFTTPPLPVSHPTPKVIRVDKFEQSVVGCDLAQNRLLTLRQSPILAKTHHTPSRPDSLCRMSLFTITELSLPFPPAWLYFLMSLLQNSKMYTMANSIIEGERWRVRDIVEASLIQTPDIQSWSQGQRKGNGLQTGTHEGLYGFPGPHRRDVKLTWEIKKKLLMTLQYWPVSSVPTHDSVCPHPCHTTFFWTVL